MVGSLLSLCCFLKKNIYDKENTSENPSVALVAFGRYHNAYLPVGSNPRVQE